MKIIYFIIILILYSCSPKVNSSNDCSNYYRFLKKHLAQEGHHLYKLVEIDNIDELTFYEKERVYIKDECLIGLKINEVYRLLGKPSKMISVGDNGGLIYCLSKDCLPDFKSSGKQINIRYEDNKVTKVLLNYFPLIQSGE